MDQSLPAGCRFLLREGDRTLELAAREVVVRDTFDYTGFQQVLSNMTWNTSRDGVATASLVSIVLRVQLCMVLLSMCNVYDTLLSAAVCDTTECCV